MKKLLLLAIGAVMLAGCSVISNLSTGGPQIVGSGKLASVTQTVGSFKSVKLEGSMDADISIGKQSGIKIEGDDNIIPNVKTEVSGDTLHIYMESGSYSSKRQLKVTFSVPELSSVVLDGSGNLAVNSYKGDSLALTINGSGDVKADGETRKLDATVNGSGDLSLFGLKAADARINIRGSGDAEVNAAKSLDGSIAGSGSIRYKGSPAVSKSVAGSGDITPVH